MRARKNAWEYYVNMVHEMDEFAGNLVRQIEERGEPTVLVFYGDHLPTMGLEAKDLKSKYLYNTNYVIWDNIGLKQEDKNLAAYQIMQKCLTVWIFIPELYSTITSRDVRRKIIRQIWNCFSTIFFTESNTPMINMALRSKKDIW